MDRRNEPIVHKQEIPKHMQRYSTSLILREIQYNKRNTRSHLSD